MADGFGVDEHIRNIDMSAEEVATLHPVTARLERFVAGAVTDLTHSAVAQPLNRSPIELATRTDVRGAYDQANQRLLALPGDHLSCRISGSMSLCQSPRANSRSRTSGLNFNARALGVILGGWGGNRRGAAGALESGQLDVARTR
jgi:hypothetical protein